MRDWLLKFSPFFYLGIMLIAAFFSLLLFSWLFILGAVVGGLLYLIAYLKRRFFTKEAPDVLVTRAGYSDKTEKTGRTIEHDDREP